MCVLGGWGWGGGGVGIESTTNPSAADPASYNAQTKEGKPEEKRCVHGERERGPLASH